MWYYLYKVIQVVNVWELNKMDIVYDIKGSVNILVKKTCPCCRCDVRMCVEGNKYEKYISTNMCVTDVFPELSMFEREFLMTGYCVTCQEKIFGRKAKKEDKASFC